MTASEPEYPDQVPRRQAYEAAHPGVEITFHGPYWRAVVHEDNGETTVVRYELRDLLDDLEKMHPPEQ